MIILLKFVLTCTLTVPGLGSSSSGFILERLWCIGSPVLLTADSLVGLVCRNKSPHLIRTSAYRGFNYTFYSYFVCTVIKNACDAFKSISHLSNQEETVTIAAF